MSLQSLPAELQAQIVGWTNAKAIISLSQTSKKLREVALDFQVLKHVIQLSCDEDWNGDRAFAELVDKAAGHDPAVWLHFAVANSKAFDLDESGVRDDGVDIFQERGMPPWLPFLLVLKHPIVDSSCWKRQDLYGPLDLHSIGDTVERLSCAGALGLSFSNLKRLDAEHRSDIVRTAHQISSDPSELRDAIHYTTHLALSRVVCMAYIAIYDERRFLAFDGPGVEWIPPPQFRSIPVLPLNTKYSLPTLSVDNSVPLDAQHPNITNAIERWRYSHSLAMADPTFLCSGEWVGYYTYDYQETLDRPTSGIRFEQYDPPSNTSSAEFASLAEQQDAMYPTQPGHEPIYLRALNCSDGPGPFNLYLRICAKQTATSPIVHVYGTKVYYTDGFLWTWNCQLSPFGIHGDYGHAVLQDIRTLGENRLRSVPRTPDYQFRSQGSLWLWKKEWSEQGKGLW